MILLFVQVYSSIHISNHMHLITKTYQILNYMRTSSRPASSHNRQIASRPETNHNDEALMKWPSLSSLSRKTPCPEQLALSFQHSQQLTFTPEVHQLPFNLYPAQWSSHLRSKQEAWESLIQDHRERDLLRAQMKIEAEEQSLAQCTFGTNRTSKKTTNDESIFERLYEEATVRRQQQQKQQMSKQQLLDDQLRNSQKTSKKHRLNQQKVDLSPLYLRLQQVLQQQAQNRKRAIQQQNIQLSFQPNIDPHSTSLANKQNRITNIVDRLLDDYKKRQNKMKKLKEKYQIIEDKELTFQPDIQTSLHTASQHRTKPQKMPQQSDFTFHPQINTLSAIITKERHAQTQQQQLFRLHSAPIIQKANKILQLQRQKYQECTFNPEINELSKQMSRTPQKVHLCKVPVQVTPNHKPSINPVSRSMTVVQRAQSMESTRKKGKEKADHYRREVEYEEMRECTFRPTLTDRKQARASQKACNLSKIAGFQRYWMQAEKAQLKEKQRKQLEEKLFRLQKSYDQRRLRELNRPIHS